MGSNEDMQKVAPLFLTFYYGSSFSRMPISAYTAILSPSPPELQ